MDQTEAEKVLRRIRAQIDGHRRSIFMYYAELKLKLPTHLKTLTLNELKEAGAIVDPNLTLSRKATNYLKKHADSTRKRENLIEKLHEVHEQHKNQISSYFKDTKRRLPPKLLKKTLNELDDADWNCLGIDIEQIKREPKEW